MGLERRREELEGRLRDMRSMLLSAAEELDVAPAEAEAPAAGDVEVDARIEKIFGPRNRVDLPDLEQVPADPDPDA
jgi:hypothetical protein